MPKIKAQQRNWIGRSTGAEVNFKTTAGDTLTVYTTRPDTLFGATYMVISPEHGLIEEKKEPLNVEIQGGKCHCFYGNGANADVEMQMSRETLSQIVSGRSTFQSAFMTGDMKMKGDFKVLRALDQVLIF